MDDQPTDLSPEAEPARSAAADEAPGPPQTPAERAPAPDAAEPAVETRAQRRARREAVLREPVLPSLTTVPRPVVVVAVVVLAALLVLALLAALGVWWLFTRSTLGFQLRSVGANPAAARVAGMTVSRVTMTAMALSGALTGLAGTLLALGGATSYAITPQIDNNVGFDAITVALLGRNTASGTAVAALLFGALLSGTSQRNLDPTIFEPELASNLTFIIQGLVVLIVSADVIVLSMVIRTRRLFRRRRPPAVATPAKEAEVA